MRIALTCCAAVALAALSGCGSSTPQAGNDVADQPTPSPQPAARQLGGPQFASAIPGLKVSATSRLPQAPAEAAERESCSHLLSDPKTAAGRQVADRGRSFASGGRISCRWELSDHGHAAEVSGVIKP